MKQRKSEDHYVIIALALFHRYGFWALLIVFMYLMKNTLDWLLMLSIAFVFYSAYTFIGFKLRWKHIYCSYQNANHQKMTPTIIRWDTLKKSDVYGVPLIFLIIGIVGMIVSICHLLS